jgi:hypothetical protein
LIENTTQPRNRFFLAPSTENPTEFVVYDSLLEQTIGQPHQSVQTAFDMVYHLNRIVPEFMMS